MQYFVLGADGKEYGPVGVDEIKEWAQDNRVAPHTQLKSFETGQTMPASSVPGLFAGAPNMAAPPQATPYPRPQDYVAPGDDGKGELIGAIWRSAAALILFFWLHGIGLIFAGYALYYAFQANSLGHRYGKVGLGIAGASFLAVLIGWIIRMQSGQLS